MAARKIKVKGHTRKNGVKVKGYTRMAGGHRTRQHRKGHKRRKTAVKRRRTAHHRRRG